MNPHAELFQRLDEILVEESPMHPFGCATWMEATQIAIDMAKEALSGPVVHGWPDREAVARLAVGGLVGERDRMHGGGYYVCRPDDMTRHEGIWCSEDKAYDVLATLRADAILALFPPVVGVRLEALFEHCEPEDEAWVVGMSPKEIAALTAEGWAGQVDTLMEDADILDREGKPGTGGRVRSAAKFIRAALELRAAAAPLTDGEGE